MIFRDHDKERRDLTVKDSSGKVADFGCLGSEGQTDGHMLHEMLKSKPGLEVVGIDIKEGADVRHDLNDFPYPFDDSSFDTVVAGYIIDHLLNPYLFLKECHRILKPGGKIIITVSNATGLTYIVNPRFSQEQEKFDNHYYAWTSPMIEKLLQTIGFQPIEIKHMIWMWNRNIPFRFLTHFVKRLRPIFYITAEKSSSIGNGT